MQRGIVLSTSAPRPKTAIVVGNGPLGSAAGRHLSELGLQVVVLGSKSLTSSSRDRGRIARGMDAEGNKTWARRNSESLKAFRELQEMTGIEFYTTCGALMVGSEAFVDRAAQGQVDVEVFDDRLQQKWNFLAKYPSAFAAFDADAGHVDPYRMVEAQNYRAQALGAQIVEDGTVERLEVCEGGIMAHLQNSVTFVADVAVVAGGAYTKHLLSVSGISTAEDNANDRSGIDSVQISRRTVLLAEVSEKDAMVMNLTGMPTVKWLHQKTSEAPEGHSQVEASSVYILPPIRYPEYDNRWYVKIGGGPNDFMQPGHDADQLEEFYQGDGDTALAAKLENILHVVFPLIEFLSITRKPCVTTCSPDGSLQLAALCDGRVIAATGCQGKAAMCADSIGREIAQLVASSD